MNRSGFFRCGLAPVLMLIAVSASAQYNKNPTLKIGDPAPPVKVQTWLRGQPVTHFETGKVYVLDFWATWCGGCIISFPHISEIANKYKSRVSFSSIDTYEAIGDTEKKEDPVVKVSKFLKTPPGRNLKLSVAVDGGSNAMWNAWIKPLRRAGLPTTYVIDQEGKIAWMDVNLDHLEWVLDQVLARKWDRQQAAVIMQQRDAIDDMWMNAMRGMGGPPTDGQLTSEQIKGNRVVLAASEEFEKQFPDRKDVVAFYKFMALLVLDRDRLPSILEQMAADPRSRYINLSDAAGLCMRRKDLSAPTYAAVVKVLERCLRNEHPQPNTCGKNVSGYERLAAAYEMAGEPAMAAVSIEKAILLASEKKVPAAQIEKLRQSLYRYQRAVAHGG